ncbi:MAG: GntR family transcriptional regulator [Planctomycetota bacterium]|jgi:DNA-binding transcriptional regulator YhcF (GntR family)
MPSVKETPKTERIVKHCLYEIATGAWAPGRRLPSLREARRLWSVNHVTVLRAYRRLAELGLVRSVTRSGFFIADSPGVAGLSRHRAELERAYRRLRGRIAREGMSVVGAFRYLAQLAEARAREEPECAFVECTAFQAEGHAREVRERLQVPCLPLTTAQTASGRIPRHLQTLITTSFHHHEVGPLADPPALTAIHVPIEFSPDLPDRLPRRTREVLILATDEEVAKHAARDARRVLGRKIEGAQVRVPELEARLERMGAGPRRAVVFSPSLWSALPERQRKTPLFLPLEYRICEPAWPRIADAIGLPLGALG